MLNLGAGNLQNGFPSVTAQVWQGNNKLPEKFTGSLPSAGYLDEICGQWQLVYQALCNRLQFTFRSLDTDDDELEIMEGSITQVSEITFGQLCQQLQITINEWLKSPEFIDIELNLRSRLNSQEEIRFIIETDDRQIRRLPWQRWKFFKDYPLAEMAFSRLEYKSNTSSASPKTSKKVRILAILGNSEGIDLEADKKFLKDLPNSEIQFLVTPSRAQLDTELWDTQGWDILFFGGHSRSEGVEGRLYINERKSHNSVTIEQLEEALKTAIDKGLKLAIFNSCDGLGLANSLGNLHIPQTIIMREPVPNRVAEEFLKYFLQAFAIEEKSLYLSVRQARNKLQGLEDNCPGASWLPVICQNPAVEITNWLDLLGVDRTQINQQNPTQNQTNQENTQPAVIGDQTPVYPSGSVPLESPFYLQRTATEEQIFREIGKPGALIRIKAPKEMGKTSLLLRVLDYAQDLGYITVSLNLEQVEQNILSNFNQFLRWLCANIAHQLKLPPQLDDYWDEDMGSKISSTLYLQGYLLENVDAPIVLALDEVNQIFEHAQVAKDFLPLLRSWYEEAKRLPIWKKLRFIVVHSTESYVPLHLNQSPFNVGLPIKLTHFNLDEIQQLAQTYGLDWVDGTEAKQLMILVGGHPALVHIAIYHLSSGDLSLSELLETAPTPTGIYANHLQRHRITLDEEPELIETLQTVMNASDPVSIDSIVAYKLNSLGLIQLVGDKAIASCELYRQYYLKSY